MSDPMGLLNISPMQASNPISFLPPDRTPFSQFVGTTTRSSFTGFRLGDLFVPDSSYVGCSKKSSNGVRGGVSVVRALTNANFSGGGGSVRELDSSSPVSVELQPILNESQFDRVIAGAQQLEEPVVILWSASWCRKCIYLKPKLEKLAADYHPRIRFYSIDVNNVPLKFVLRAGVTKMPTIQLWKDSAKHAEVIGGHEAYLVVNEVREMIENEDEL